MTARPATITRVPAVDFAPPLKPFRFRNSRTGRYYIVLAIDREDAQRRAQSRHDQADANKRRRR